MHIAAVIKPSAVLSSSMMFNNSPKSRKEQSNPNKITTIFHDPYILDRLNNERSVPLYVKESVLLLEGSILTIDHFEHEVEMEQQTTLHIEMMKIEVFVVGRKYRRFRDCEDLGGFLVYDPKEVYMCNRDRHLVTEIYRKVTIVKTNHSYPNYKSGHPLQYVCRFRRKERAVVGLTAEQADEGRTRIDDRRKRNMFIYRRANPPPRPPGGRYTLGDAFCGIGGCSAGARRAGFEIKWAFDADEQVSRVYSENFPETEVIGAKVDHFLASDDKRLVDVLHLSPPCQTWSMAHTIEGQNDDANSASLFSVKELLSVSRPRIATVEQVPGIMIKNDNKNFFYVMLRDFLEMGYSIQWDLLRAENYGVPQTRKRLILLASCPGQSLPQFPPHTHGKLPLPPYVSLADAIDDIRPNDRLHDVRGCTFPFPRYSTIEPYLPFPGTIMASGTEHVFPDGSRRFTLRELARIQTFSDAHLFGPTYIQKQIGNAVPPLLAQRIFESVLRKLTETDDT